MKIGLVLFSMFDSRSVGELARIASSFGTNSGAEVILKFVGPRVDFDNRCFEFADNGTQKLIEAKTFETWAEYGQSEPDSVRIVFNGGHGLRYPEILSESALPFAVICSRIQTVLSEGAAPLKSFDLIFSGAQQETKYNSDRLCAFIIEWQAVLAGAHFVCAPPQLPLSLQAFLATTKLLEMSELVAASDIEKAPIEEMDFHFPEVKLQEWLLALGIDVHKGNAYSSLKRLLAGRLASKDELRVLSAVIQQTVRKLKDSSLA